LRARVLFTRTFINVGTRLARTSVARSTVAFISAIVVDAGSVGVATMIAVRAFIDILAVVADLHEARLAMANVRAKGVVTLSRFADALLAAFVDVEAVFSIATESRFAGARIRAN